MIPDEVPESLEAQVEGLRRDAAGLDDYQLDLALAVAQARRDVAAAHRLDRTAAVWQDVLLAYDDVRRARQRVRAEIEELTGPPPPIIRALTPEELAEDTQEPPC